ncbi:MULTISPECIES: hypothetical protein [unclassified Micromonospora]|uniref:hypothetical protein n=1 Tax=unclassified Micromonospora TaxID=2617518 RepID=UPI003A84184E
MTGLFPDNMRAGLPTRKRYYATALTRSVMGPLAAPVCVGAGLLDAAAVTSYTDPATRMMVTAVESWLAGAATRGFAFSG